MSYIGNQFLALVRQLLPKGRAFVIPSNSELETLQKAIDTQLESCYDNEASILNSLLPDNPYFTDGTVNVNDNDCNDWERRTGIIQWGVTSSLTPTRLQRMALISAKMTYPGTTECRQTAQYLQTMLQAAGFNVYVHENLSNLTPAEVLGTPTGRAYLGAFDLGQLDLAEDWDIENVTIIANYLNPAQDDDFVVPPDINYGTFFIGGSTLTSFPSIPAVLQPALRQMVLNIKPAHMAAFTFINFT